MATKRTAKAHNHLGNCWEKKMVYSCADCRPGNLCDVCHLHDEPRGECSECAACPKCEAEQ